MPKKTYTVREVADLLGFSTNTVYKYLDEGRIKSTRLGKEGRFRIPSSELSTLLQASKTESVQVQPQPASLTPELAEVEISESKIRGAPSLFDWFIAFLSIFLGFSQFIFPSYYTASATRNLLGIILFLQTLLFIGGFVLIGFDIVRYKKRYLHTLTHFVIGFVYLALTVLFVVIGAIPNAVGYLAVSIVVFITVFLKLSQHARFIIFTNLLMLFLGVGVLIRPDSFFLANIIGVNTTNVIIFLFAWLLVGSVNLYLSFLAIRKSRKYIWVIAVPTAFSALLYATFTFTNGFWARAIYCVVLASFALIFPFADQFESFTLRSKKELTGSFAWLLGLFFIGSAMLFFVYRSFQNYALGELTNRVATASDIVSNFMNGNVAKVSSFAVDEEIIGLMRNQGAQNTAIADQNLKQLYQSSNGTLRRAVLTDRNGIIVDTYLLNLSSLGVDISNRDYYIAAKSGLGTSVSGIIQPSSPGISPAVLILVPITDSTGLFLGALSGSVDLDELARRIGQIKFGANGAFLLADSNGDYIIPPTPEEILTRATSGSPVLRAVGGESGTTQGYDAGGSLSLVAFKHIDDYNWGIVAQQPFGDVFAPYSLAGFIIFLVFIISGVGSLVLVIYLRKKGSDKLL
jgi:excisionase family DNA binding protein